MLNRRAFVMGLLVFGSGCRGEATALEPVWGKQPCVHCRMLVGDPRYAAQLLTPDGERAYFDDVGCMASYLAQHRAAKAWVRAADGRWLEASATRYRTGAATPMDYGFIVDANGPLDFTAVRAGVAQRERGGAS